MRNIEIIHRYSIDFTTDDMTIKGADGELLVSQFSDQCSAGKSSAIQSQFMGCCQVFQYSGAV
jgi:hypothetical protein